MADSKSLKEDAHSRACKVLKYWHKVEHFIPFDLAQISGQNTSRPSWEDFFKRDIYLLKDEAVERRMPWLNPCAKQRYQQVNNIEYSYDLYVLPFDKNILTSVANEKFPIKGESFFQGEFLEERAEEGETCFAKIKLDSYGRLNLSEPSISTMPWALGKLLKGKADEINAFQFSLETDRLLQRMRELNSQWIGEIRCIGDKKIQHYLNGQYLEDLVSLFLSWADGLEEQEEFKKTNELAFIFPYRDFAPRSYEEPALSSTKPKPDENKDSDEREEIDILNSFYIKDLEKICNAITPTIQDYILGWTDEANKQSALNI